MRLRPCAVHDLLHPEVAVDEDLGLDGQADQLQVPAGVVGGDVAQAAQVPGGVVLVGVVVVQARDAPGLVAHAAELAHVVADGAAVQERQVHRDGPGQLPPDPQGEAGDPQHVVLDGEAAASAGPWPRVTRNPSASQVLHQAPVLLARRPQAQLVLGQGLERHHGGDAVRGRTARQRRLRQGEERLRHPARCRIGLPEPAGVEPAPGLRQHGLLPVLQRTGFPGQVQGDRQGRVQRRLLGQARSRHACPAERPRRLRTASNTRTPLASSCGSFHA